MSDKFDFDPEGSLRLLSQKYVNKKLSYFIQEIIQAQSVPSIIYNIYIILDLL